MFKNNKQTRKHLLWKCFRMIRLDWSERRGCEASVVDCSDNEADILLEMCPDPATGLKGGQAAVLSFD